MSWTDERIEELRRMWAEGLSASQIASVLGGVSRNAVIGKVHRLGLSGRVKTPARSASRRPAASNSRSRPATPPAARSAPRVMAVGSTVVKVVETAFEAAPLPVAEVLTFSEGVSLMELEPGCCRWPVGDPAEAGFRFCGVKTASGETYCAGHAAAAYPSRAKAARKAG